MNILDLFISSAYADPISTTPAPQGSGYSFLIMLAVFTFFIYFTVWRPQNKRTQELKSLMNSLNIGDEVMTAGGLLGKLTKVTEQYVSLNIAPNVDVTLQKNSVVKLLPKGTLKSLV